MKNSTHSRQAFRELQNKFRGLAAGLKSRRFVRTRTSSPSRRFRRGIRHLFLVARVELPANQFDDFLQWVNRQIASQLPELAAAPIAYDELSGVITAEPVSLIRELQWIAARIRAAQQMIRNFNKEATKIERLIYEGDYESAKQNLEEVENAFGASIWSIQLRIALEQMLGGLEAQKHYVAAVRGIHKRGLLGFIAYNTSVRNEDKTTYNKFIEDIKARINNHNYYDEAIKTYQTYRLAGEWPDNNGGLADILRIEQSHSLIDIYQTFIAIVQEISRRKGLSEIWPGTVECLRSIVDVDDFRIHKAIIVLERAGHNGALRHRNTSISNALFEGDAKRAALLARRIAVKTDLLDAWEIIYAGVAFAHASRTREAVTDRGLKSVPRYFGQFLSGTEHSETAHAALRKMTANFSGLPFAAALAEALKQIHRTLPDDTWEPWLVSLNSPTYGIEDIPANDEDLLSAFDTLPSIESKSATARCWLYFHYQRSADLELNTQAEAVFKACGLVVAQEHREAADILVSLDSQAVPQPLRLARCLLLLHANFALGNRTDVIELIACEGSSSKMDPLFFLPIGPALENYVWPDYQAVQAPLAASIAISLLLKWNESEATASLLRFATKTALRQSVVGTPSKMADRIEIYPKHQLIYFLRYVCVPNILDGTRVLKSSREVAEERQRICASLRFLDSENAEIYEQEVTNITNQLALAEGQWVLDSTRIHVDTDALVRWASRELSEDFERYLDLVALQDSPEQNFDDVLKELLNGRAVQRQMFVPENEADTVLLGILGRLGEEFLTNASFGLDFYLSKRIRHQSFIGFIRGPLEFSNLITTRETATSAYRRNNFWLDKLDQAGCTDIGSIDAAFFSFAANFDEMLSEAKDERFQIRSTENPNGLIYIELTAQLMSLARAVAHMDSNLHEFMHTCVAVLWAAVIPSLANVRRFISEDLKAKISDEFDRLRANIKYNRDENATFLELDAVIGKSSVEVQHALDDAASWFTYADAESHKRYFTLEETVSIGIESALKCQRAFEPTIEKQVSGELEMSASSLVFVHDVLFVALDNVRAHSGLENPHISISVEPNIEAEKLCIRVESEIRPQNRLSVEEGLVEIRKLINSAPIGRRTRREGKSGFLKLAAVVKQSPNGSLEFGVTDDGCFRLAVDYSLIVQEGEPEGHPHG